MGNGEIWGIGGVGNLHDIFHQMLICPVDALLDLGLRDQIERDLGVSRVFGLAGSVWKGMGSGGVLMFSVWQLAASPNLSISGYIGESYNRSIGHINVSMKISRRNRQTENTRNPPDPICFHGETEITSVENFSEVPKMRHGTATEHGFCRKRPPRDAFLSTEKR